MICDDNSSVGGPKLKANQSDDSESEGQEVIPGVRQSAPAFYARGTNLVKRKSVRGNDSRFPIIVLSM